MLWSSSFAGATGININTANAADQPSLGTYGGRLYAAIREYDMTGGGIRVQVYNGNDAAPHWSVVDGGADQGLNYSASGSAEFPVLIPTNTGFYCSWDEGGAVYQIRMSSGH
jgi:hypothetical protein